MSLLLLFKDRVRVDVHDGGAPPGGAVWVYKPPKEQEPVEVQVLVDVPEEPKKRKSLKISRRKKVYLDELKSSEKLALMYMLKNRILELLSNYEQRKQELLDRAEEGARAEYERMLREEALAQARLLTLRRLLRIQEDEMLFILLI